jgi:hypothetical protein
MMAQEQRPPRQPQNPFHYGHHVQILFSTHTRTRASQRHSWIKAWGTESRNPVTLGRLFHLLCLSFLTHKMVTIILSSVSIACEN